MRKGKGATQQQDSEPEEAAPEVECTSSRSVVGLVPFVLILDKSLFTRAPEGVSFKGNGVSIRAHKPVNSGVNFPVCNP